MPASDIARIAHGEARRMELSAEKISADKRALDAERERLAQRSNEMVEEVNVCRCVPPHCLSVTRKLLLASVGSSRIIF